MKFNISDHVLVPKHRKLGKEEAEKILKVYGDKKKFPKIRKDDPGIKDLGAEVGDIIEISRKMSDKEYKYYRVVIEK